MSVRNSDPMTSRLAAESIDVTKLEKIVVDCLLKFQVPMTTLQIAKETGINVWSISPRMKPLEKAKHVKCVGSFPALNSGGNIRLLRHYLATTLTLVAENG